MTHPREYKSLHDKAKVDDCWFGLSCYVDECATFYTHSHLIGNQYPNLLDWMGPSDERPGIISKINYSYIRSTRTVAINLQATCSSKGSMHYTPNPTALLKSNNEFRTQHFIIEVVCCDSC